MSFLRRQESDEFSTNFNEIPAFAGMTGMKKKILIAPLNWGLGHTARCIPIIKALLKHDFEPILASDGDALALLQKEFPLLKSYQLPSYNIKYSKGSAQKLKLFLNSPTILKASISEQKEVRKIHKKENLSGIISDNRFGVRLTAIPSVYITHQINVLSGKTTAITSNLHQKIIAKFDQCWVPDFKDAILSGKLSSFENKKLNIKYIGAISRLEQQTLPIKYDLLIVLSGPEPQRTLLEEKLIAELKTSTKKTLLVRGVFSNTIVAEINKYTTVVNYMLTEQLQQAFNESKVVLARSGYSTILDLAKLEKKAFFIPTPGQYEQKYLAERMKDLGIAPFTTQKDFKLNMLTSVDAYHGFINSSDTTLNVNLFELF